MTNFKIFLFILINFIVVFAKISDQRRCANKDCSEPISFARTLIKYRSDDSRILSFPANAEVTIFSKEAGSRLDLWGAEINGKRGYVPKEMVRETSVLPVKVDKLVFTEGVDDPYITSAPPLSKDSSSRESLVDADSVPVVVPAQDKISPNAVTPPYEVIDGTTIYPQSNENSDFGYTTESSTDSSNNQPTENLAYAVNIKAAMAMSNDTTAKLSETKEENNKIITETVAATETNESETNEQNSEINKREPETVAVIETNESETKKDNNEIIKIETDINQSVIKKESNEIEPDAAVKEEIKNKEEIDTVKKEDNERIEQEKKNENLDEADVSVEEDNEDHPEDDDYTEGEEEEMEFGKEEEIETSTEVAGSEENHENLETDKASKSGDINENNTDSVISKTENVIDISKNSTDSVIATEEAVKNTTDQFNSKYPQSKTPEAAQESIINTNNSETKSVQNEAKDEPQENMKDKQDSVPSKFPNPLNMFRQPVKQELKIEETQVPENISTNESQPPLTEQPTTQASVDIHEPPPNLETYTENPISSEEKEDLIEPKVEELKAKIEPEIKTENDEINPNSSEHLQNQSDEDITNDKIEDIDENEAPTFIDPVSPDTLDVLIQKDTIYENIEKDSVEETAKLNLIEEVVDETEENEEPGIFSKIYNAVFGSKDDLEPSEESVTEKISDTKFESEISGKSSEKSEEVRNNFWNSHSHEKPVEKYLPSSSSLGRQNQQSDMESCSSDNPALCAIQSKNEFTVQPEEFSWSFELPENAYNIFLYLSLTAFTVLVFSLGFYYIEKKRKDGSLIASINNLEKKLLVSTKECLLLQDELKITKERLVSIEDSSFGSNEMVNSLKEELEDARLTRIELEEQVANLEKELENATEAGMELNRMLRDILTSQSGNEHLMQNVEHLQKQLNEQQETINSMKVTLSAKNTENELLQTELSVANEKNIQLQEELDKMVVNLLSVQEEKNNMENTLEQQNEKLKSEYEATIKNVNSELNILKEDNKQLKRLVEDTQRSLDLKNNEYDLLKQGVKELQATQSNKDSIMALLDVSQVKAEVQQLRDEKHKISDQLQKETDEKLLFEKEVQVMIQEVRILKDKFDEAEKEKVEAQTRLEVLSAYFKEKEAQLQKEINENESKFMQKEGEATSTIERIKWIQEELQNYKAQNELLKKEILDQEVSLKSQISMLEKKSHDNWVLARQAERRLEESKQEASQLRNRLTIVEKNLNNSTHISDDPKLSNRIMSPLDSNGELPVSPLHMSQVDAPGSPPLLFPHRDHMTTSPPLPGLPHFMPPPPGAPFMPPPIPGVPHFMPPPPALFPGDHRPPPLGRMSSPPLHGRYSPDSRAYSPYDRDDSPPLSPAYPDSDYRRRSPPPPNRIYSPYSGSKPARHWERDDEREYRGQQRKSRTHKGLSSGSGNSNESLDNSGRHSGRV